MYYFRQFKLSNCSSKHVPCLTRAFVTGFHALSSRIVFSICGAQIVRKNGQTRGMILRLSSHILGVPSRKSHTTSLITCLSTLRIRNSCVCLVTMALPRKATFEHILHFSIQWSMSVRLLIRTAGHQARSNTPARYSECLAHWWSLH